jgi:hypothetical protein
VNHLNLEIVVSPELLWVVPGVDNGLQKGLESFCCSQGLSVWC